MLQFGSKTFEVDGVTVFADHDDQNQFWYLASEVALGQRRSDGRPAITFIKYKPAAVAAGVKGGGFLTFETTVPLPAATHAKIMGRLSAIVPRGEPKLTAGTGGGRHRPMHRAQPARLRRHRGHAPPARRLQPGHPHPGRHETFADRRRDSSFLTGAGAGGRHHPASRPSRRAPPRSA